MRQTSDYTEINRAAYEATAHEFEQKIELRRVSDERLVPDVCGYFENIYNPARILELGPGSGYVAKLLSERGHHVTAIEFSPKMAEVAQRTAPQSRVVVGDFLDHDFGAERFDAIVGIAFITRELPEQR
jgi:protein-L-isoaspartate O-methyltransferase